MGYSYANIDQRQVGQHIGKGMKPESLAVIKKVVVKNHVSAVNSYLDLGWKVIMISSGKDEEGYPSVRYDLGWVSEGNPVEPKQV